MPANPELELEDHYCPATLQSASAARPFPRSGLVLRLTSQSSDFSDLEDGRDKNPDCKAGNSTEKSAQHEDRTGHGDVPLVTSSSLGSLGLAPEPRTG